MTKEKMQPRVMARLHNVCLSTRDFGFEPLLLLQPDWGGSHTWTEGIELLVPALSEGTRLKGHASHPGLRVHPGFGPFDKEAS